MQCAIKIANFTISSVGGISCGDHTTILVIIKTAINLLIIIAAIATLFYLIWGGFKWMTSGGDKQKLQEAKMAITYAVIGLVVSLSAFLIINVLGTFFGVNLLNPFP